MKVCNKCTSCKGRGYTLVEISFIDGLGKELCEDCKGEGIVFSSEWEKDQYYGKL